MFFTAVGYQPTACSQLCNCKPTQSNILSISPGTFLLVKCRISYLTFENFWSVFFVQSLVYPCKHTTSFWRCNNVVDVWTTLLQRQNVTVLKGILSVSYDSIFHQFHSYKFYPFFIGSWQVPCICKYPPSRHITQRLLNVVSTSIERFDVTMTLFERRNNVVCRLGSFLI